MKTVKDTFGKIKGEDKINDMLTGKGSFSRSGFSDAVNAMVNDTTFKLKTYGKDGKPNGEICLSDMIRSDLQTTIKNAGYPQKTEAGVLESADICTKGLAEAIPHMVEQYMMCGKKFDLPNQPSMTGSVYLADVPGKTKTIQVRDPKTQENLGTATITTKDSVQIRAKSPVPDHLQTKVRKDANGKVIS